MNINQGINYIYSDSEKGFWSNKDGWGAFETASEFVDDDLPMNIPKGGRIVTASEAESLSDDPDSVH